VTLAEYQRSLHRLANGGARRLLRKAALTSALEGERIAKTETYPAAGLRVRSGRLRASIGGSSREADEGAELVLSAGGSRAGRDVVYAGVHEGLNPDGSRRTSTTIRPKNGRYLRVPLGPAMTGAGVDRFPGRLRETGAGLFAVAMTRGKKLVLVHQGSGRTRGGDAWYALVPQVTVPARPFLRPALEKVRPIVAERIAKGLEEAIRGGPDA
jgi:hypothetical protein